MEWRDEGIILGGRRHGETSLILEVMTREHGRHPGLVKGGRSKRLAPLLQPGNLVDVTWRARLEEHLGLFNVETTSQRGSELMLRPASLHGLNLLVAHLLLLAEREPHAALFDTARQLLDLFATPQVAAAALIRFELMLLAETGFGLDLTSCAATGEKDELVFVSPKSGRAVSRVAGHPYRDRLLALPPFLIETDPLEPTPAEIDSGFRLTGFFLERNLLGPRGLALPEARSAFMARITSRDGQMT